MRLLLVEDDPAIAEPLTEGLEREGYEVDWVQTGADALAAAPADLVVLDLGLPDVDGIKVCHDLRARAATPIVIISARDAEIDRVVGLEMGADDYLVKPFGFRELVARIRAVTRRALPEPDPLDDIDLGALRVERRAHRVTVLGEPVALTVKEHDLLVALAAEAGSVVTRQRLLEQVWTPHWYGPTKTLDVHIASLRRKLGHPEWIETVRGVGFRMTPECGAETTAASR